MIALLYDSSAFYRLIKFLKNKEKEQHRLICNMKAVPEYQHAASTQMIDFQHAECTAALFYMHPANNQQKTVAVYNF